MYRHCRQLLSGRKTRDANRARATRLMHKLEDRAVQERRRADRYRKKYQRLLKKIAKNKKETPRSKTRRLLRYCNVSSDVRRTLLFHNAVVENLRKKYTAFKSRLARNRMKKLLMSKTVKRCKVEAVCRQAFGFSTRVKYSTKLRSIDKTGFFSVVKEFYNRDDVSRITAGKRETVTHKKTKMQRRFIVDSLQNLHRKFLSENPQIKISYSLFCRQRPFWVLLPNMKSRDTCLCKLHENLAFLANKLVRMHLLFSSNLEALADSCSCNSSSKSCMYGTCQVCVQKTPQLLCDYVADARVSYFQWTSASEEKTNKNGQRISVKVTRKETIESSLQELLTNFYKQLLRFKKHIFIIRHQFSQYRYLKGTLHENECMLHIDFAENFVCQYATEIQSVHFGGSHEQATLHTGVLYTNDGRNSQSASFCTISNSRHHGPAAIWVYLDPVLRWVKDKHPMMETIHFFSDSPSTQYRQKLNFYLFSTQLREYEFKYGTWNFSEAGHGKGAADGVGGALKRTADRLISLNSDINTPRRLYDALCSSKTTVQLFFVDSDKVDEGMGKVPSTVLPIPGTMNIHQLICLEFGKLKYRDVSCFCSNSKIKCECYNIKDFSFDVQDIPALLVDTPITHCTDGHAKLSNTGKGQSVIELFPDLVGQYCLILYDGKAYPGKILQVDVDDDDALVRCMARIGENRFFWPMCEDVAWYMRQDILAIIEEPTPVGRGRHCQVDPHVWQKVQQQLL